MALVVNTLTLFNAGAAPTLTNTTGDVVSLPSGSTVRGLFIGNHPSGVGILGANVGTLTIDTVTINGTGKIADFIERVVTALESTSRTAPPNSPRALASHRHSLALHRGSVSTAKS